MVIGPFVWLPQSPTRVNSGVMNKKRELIIWPFENTENELRHQ
jgi:hypothetical protein